MTTEAACFTQAAVLLPELPDSHKYTRPRAGQRAAAPGHRMGPMVAGVFKHEWAHTIQRQRHIITSPVYAPSKLICTMG